MNGVTRAPAYGRAAPPERHSGTADRPAVTDLAVVALAVAVAVGVWTGDVAVAACAAVGLVSPFRSGRLVAVAVLLAVTGAIRSERAWAGLAPDELGPYEGWVRLVDDPQPFPAATRLIVEIEGERFETWIRGRARQLRVSDWRAGQRVLVEGTRTPLAPERAGRVAWQHVVGGFEVDWASDVDQGSAMARASNRLRAAVERASASLPPGDGALFRGLVVGDDREQPRPMIDRFRASGLSHLTAVSGQNVAFVLAAAGPLLRRLRPWPRWLATLGLIGWFVVLTRVEPSIVRAGAMAALSATAFATGHERAPLRVLALAVAGLTLLDPLLVWSVGFWLSVGATAGVCAIGPWTAARCSELRGLAMPFGVTLGAQLGVAVPSLLVFGRLPLVSIPANLLAVPIAGLVMLYGLPAALVAGWLPWAAPVLMLPARFGTRWVDTVALLGERLEPDPPWQWCGWVVVGAGVLAGAARSARRDKNRPLGDASADR